VTSLEIVNHQPFSMASLWECVVCRAPKGLSPIHTGPKSLESQFMQSQLLRAWKLGCVLRVGLSKKLDTNPTNIFAYNNQDPT
jgi:hypothetical protein